MNGFWEEHQSGSNSCAGSHAAHVFADSLSLGQAIATLALEAVHERKGVLLIATPEHLRAIERCLEELHADVTGLRESGQVHLQDAQQALEYIMEGERPNPLVFDGLVCDAIAQMTASHYSGIVVYGELANLLRAQGRFEAAATIEGWWNKLIAQYQLSLLCGCQAGPMDADDQARLNLAGQRHKYAGAEADDDRRLRA